MKKGIRISNESNLRHRREEIFYAYFIEDMSKEMIAEELGCSLSTVERDIRYIKQHVDEFM